MIVKVLHFVAIMNRGGQETLLMNVFRGIDRSLVSFDFLCSVKGEGDYDEEIRSLGGRIYCLDYELESGRFKCLKNAFRLSQWLKSHSDYQIFHVHTCHAFDAALSVVAAKFAGVKRVIIHSHNTNISYHLAAHMIARELMKVMPIERFACSQEAGKWMFGNMNFKLIRNGIISEKFTFDSQIRRDTRNKLHWNNKKIIGHVGRFNNQKNHRFLIRIFQELHRLDPCTNLVLIGRGENEDMIRKYVLENELQDYVTFLGVRSDMENLYQGMDLFLFPSIYEGLPVVLVEAQAASLPCLISDVISDEIDITNYIHRASLDFSAKEWAVIAKNILDGEKKRSDINAEIIRKGYDIDTTMQELQKYYLAK